VGAPIVGALLAAYVTGIIVPSGPLAGTDLPSLIAFRYAFWIAAAVTLAGAIAVLFGQEVLGPRRHPKFAHLPTLPRKVRLEDGAPALPMDPRPGDSARAWQSGR
jgi:hypothetical protein